MRNAVIGVLAGLSIFLLSSTLKLHEDKKILEIENNSYIEKLYKIDGKLEKGELLPVTRIYDCYPEDGKDVCIIDADFDY